MFKFEMMDLRHTWITSPSGLFRPIISDTTGEFLHRFVFETEGTTCECPTKIISDFLFAEYQFRAVLQRKEGIEENCYDERLRDEINTRFIQCERNLFFKDAALPPATLDEMRIFAGKDPRWYLRASLVNYCDFNGGCCGQSCGCCEKRASQFIRKCISGHCTWACRCCRERKGSRLKDYDGDALEQEYKDALASENPAFLLRMADCYFSKPRSRSPSDPEFNGDVANNAQFTPYDRGADGDSGQIDEREVQESTPNTTPDPSPPPPYMEVSTENIAREREQRRKWPWNRTSS